MELSFAERARTTLAAAIPDLDRRAADYRVVHALTDADLVEALMDHVRSERTAVRQALGAGDFERVAHFAHGLKGLGGSIGLPEVSAAGAVLEEEARAGRRDNSLRIIQALESWAD